MLRLIFSVVVLPVWSWLVIESGVLAYRMEPDDGECIRNGRRSAACAAANNVTVAPPPGASCYEWNYDYMGNNLTDPVTVSTIGMVDQISEAPNATLDINALGHMVARPYDCQRGCQSYDGCEAWTFSKVEGCYLKSSAAGRRYVPEDNSETTSNWYVSGAKYSTDCDGGLVSPCYEYNVACILSAPRSHFPDGRESTTIHECHEMCKGVPGCLAFAWHDRYPRKGKVLRGVCFLCGNKDRKMCSPGAVMGWVEGRDCGPAEGTTFPPAPTPPLDTDGLHLMAADPSLYYGLPIGENARALGKGGTQEEKAFLRGDLGAPPYLTEPLRYAVRANDLARVELKNCGCFHLGVQPDPQTSQIVQNLALLVYPPEQCQLLCQQDPDCEAFSSTFYKCLLWRDVTQWNLDQIEAVIISGPKWCPEELIAQGYVCSLDHYRARFTSWALFLLHIPDITDMPFGESCPVQVNPSVLIVLLVAGVVVLMAFLSAWYMKRQHRRTVIWRVVTAVLAALGTILHVAFVVSLFRLSGNGWLFWFGCGHFLFMILFDEITVVLYNLRWVMSQPSYRTWFDSTPRSLNATKHTTNSGTTTPFTNIFDQLSSSQTQSQSERREWKLKKSVTFEAVHQSPPPPSPPVQEGNSSNIVPDTDDDLVSYCPSFNVSELSDEAVFGPFQHEQAPQLLDSTQDNTEDTQPSTTSSCGSTAVRLTDSCPVVDVKFFAAESTECGSAQHTDMTELKVAMAERGATEEWDDERAFGGSGPGLVVVLFASFFSIGVLHLCWSHLVPKKPFFAIPVASDQFASLELLSLVGYVPMLTLQLLAVFMSGGDGVLADVMPAVTLTAALLSAISIAGVVVRFVWWRLRKGDMSR